MWLESFAASIANLMTNMLQFQRYEFFSYRESFFCWHTLYIRWV